MSIAIVMSRNPLAPVYLMRCHDCENDCPKSGQFAFRYWPADCVREIAASDDICAAGKGEGE